MFPAIKTISIVSIGLVCAQLSPAQWVNLLNGKNLDGWEVVGQRSTGPVPRERYDVWLDGGSGCCRLETRRGELAGLARPSFHIVG